ncbi:MAG: hypothetical protein SFW07_01350 [Gammaproteobacteria bacterium]|nr:hypothetical protein [Gammaproteobacteria bacterium]
MQDILEYLEDESGVLGHIVVVEEGNAMVSTPLNYSINDATGIVLVLSKILSAEKANAAEHSPLLSRSPGYQGSEGQPPKAVKMNGDGNDEKNLFRLSGDSVVLEEVPADSTKIVFSGFSPEHESESKSSAKWCTWFRRCCSSSPETNPLLTSEPTRKLT